MPTPSNTLVPTLHTLPESLLEQPLSKRVELAMQHWMDLYPATTAIRLGEDPATGDIVLGQNVYGPRLAVMTKKESYEDGVNVSLNPYSRDSNSPLTSAKSLGLTIRPWLASDPSVDLFYSKPGKMFQYDFRKELVRALNHGLASVGCKTHRVKLSDHTPEYERLSEKYWSDSGYADNDKLYDQIQAMRDPKATLVWQKKDTFAAETPAPAVFEELNKFFADYVNHPVTSHVTLADTIVVKTLNPKAWEPMPKTEVERLVLAARKDLANPEHPWAKAHADESGPASNVYAYLASKHAQPLVRNGHRIYQGLRFDQASETDVGYVVMGTESCGTQGIQNTASELIRQASRGELSQVQLQLSDLPDVLVSLAYHEQVHAHQKERAAWAKANPVELQPATGPVMPKAIMDLQVGDHVGIRSNTASKNVDLWCEVTKREGDVATMFIHNGHWDFQLDLTSNQSLAHDIVKNFAGSASVVYTADTPIKDGALYNEALAYINAHMDGQTPNAGPSL